MSLETRLKAAFERVAATIKQRGLPAGGGAGQVLTKASGSDYATGWTTPAAGGGGLTGYTVTATGGLTNTYTDINSVAPGTRGDYATDLQARRSAATEIASGPASAIIGGRGNTASGDSATAGGYNNKAGGYGAIALGAANIANGSYSTAFGASNTASGSASTASGEGNTASGWQSTAFGAGCKATARGSVALGLYARADLRGQLAFSGGGSGQSTCLVLSGTTSTTTPTRLLLGDTDQLTLLDNQALAFDGVVVARNRFGDAAAWRVSGLAIRSAGAATTALIGNPSVTQLAASAGRAAAWGLAVNATGGVVALTVIGDADGYPVAWCASLDAADVIRS